MLKIIIISIISLFLASITKKSNPEISSLISVCGGVLIFSLSISGLKNIVDFFLSVYDFTNFGFDFVEGLLKVVGVGYIVEFAVDLANDFGNSIIASKVMFGGKVVICGMSIPIIKDLLSVLLSFL